MFSTVCENSVNETQTVPYGRCRYRECTLTEVGSCPYDGCSPASSGTKTTSVAVSICKMNKVAEVRRTVLTLYSMNRVAISNLILWRNVILIRAIQHQLICGRR